MVDRRNFVTCPIGSHRPGNHTGPFVHHRGAILMFSGNAEANHRIIIKVPQALISHSARKNPKSLARIALFGGIHIWLGSDLPSCGPDPDSQVRFVAASHIVPEDRSGESERCSPGDSLSCHGRAIIRRSHSPALCLRCCPCRDLYVPSRAEA